MSGGALLGLGRLVSLVCRSGSQRVELLPPSLHFLAWDAAERALVLVRPGYVPARPGYLDTPADAAAAQRAHVRFHGAEPGALAVVDVPKPGRGMRQLGLAESVSYCAAGWKSPVKRGAVWLHQFGDDGSAGRDTVSAADPSQYSTALMPGIWCDDDGGLWLRRRPGNRFTVEDWIIS
jgi:hypothetical protein